MPRYLILTLLLSLLVPALSGCAQRSEPGLAAGAPPPSSGPQAADGSAFGLPAPDSLKLPAPPRRASYAEADLVKNGAAYESALTHFNVTAAGSELNFAPDYSGSADALDTLAVALYVFNVPGYDRQSQLRSVWSSPPADTGDLWYCLANWKSNRWDLYQCPADYKLLLPSFDDYINFAGSFVLAVLQTGSDASILSSLRLAAPLPTAALSSDVIQGAPNLSVNFDASASSAAEGSIVKYEFDKGNGVVVDRGTDPSFSTIYTNPGPHSATVRVTDSQGGTATAAVTIRVTPAWAHCYSRGGDEIFGLAIDPAGNIYACGLSSGIAKPSYGVVWKYDAYGNLIWVRGTGGGNFARLERCTIDGDGNLVLCGSESIAGGGRAILLKWNPDGEAIWTRAFQGTQSAGLREALVYGSDIYAVGSRDDGNDDSQLVAMRVSGDGNLVWARRWNYGPGYSSQAFCGALRTSDAVGGFELIAAGYGGVADFSVPVFEPSPLLVGWDADGALLRSWRIGDGSYTGFVYSLRVTGTSAFSNRIVALGSHWTGTENQQYLFSARLNGANDGGVLYGQVGYNIESKDICTSPLISGWLTAGAVTISGTTYGSLVGMDIGAANVSQQYYWDSASAGTTAYYALRPAAGGGVVMGGSTLGTVMPGTRGTLSGAGAAYSLGWDSVSGVEEDAGIFLQDTAYTTIVVSDGLLDDTSSGTSALVRYDPLVN